MNKLQIKLERLELMLIEDGYNEANIVLQTVIDMQKEAINYTGCCTELKDKGSMTFEGYLIYKNILKDNGKYFLKGQEVDEFSVKFMYNELIN
jgi:hypothetical protein